MSDRWTGETGQEISSISMAVLRHLVSMLSTLILKHNDNVKLDYGIFSLI